MLRDAVLFVGGALAVLWRPGDGALASGADALVLARVLAALLAVVPWCRPFRRLWPAVAGGLLACLALQSHEAGRIRTDERLLVDAVINGLPRQLPDGWQFDALLRFPRDPERRAVQARVTWRGAQVRPVAGGEHWRFAMALRPPDGTVNPGVPQAARILLRDHVQGLGQVLQAPRAARTQAAAPSLLRLRERLATRIGTSVADPAAGALLAALAVGATTAVQPEQWRVFNATGITHLVAISGMHVTVFAVAAMAVARRLWAFAARRGLRLRREPCAAVAGLLLATGYALLAGFSVPTQRTLVMLAAFLGWRCAGRAARPSTSVAVALVAIVAFEPFALLSAGFWLSFLAVAAIIAFVGCRLPAPSGLRAAATVQWAVAATLLPVSLAIFDGYSLAGLVVNVFAIPLFSWLLVPPVLLATGLLVLPLPGAELAAQGLLACAGWVATVAWPWLGTAADWPFALVQAVPPVAWYPLAAAGVLVAVLPWAPRLRLLALSCLLPLCLDVRRELPPGALRAEVLDVGRGLAVLVETGTEVLLFGTGETFGSAGRVMERVVVPVARTRGLRHIDHLVAGRLTGDAGHGVTAALAFLGQPTLAATPMPGRGLAPEFTDCAQLADREVDGFAIRPLRGAAGCSLWIGGPGGALLLLDPAGDAAFAAGVTADVVVASKPPPPVADAGARPRLVVASIARSALESAGWRALADGPDPAATQRLATATHGAIRITLAAGALPRVETARSGRPVEVAPADAEPPRASAGIRYDAAPCGKSSVLAASSCGRSSSAP